MDDQTHESLCPHTCSDFVYSAQESLCFMLKAVFYVIMKTKKIKSKVKIRIPITDIRTVCASTDTDTPD